MSEVQVNSTDHDKESNMDTDKYKYLDNEPFPSWSKMLEFANKMQTFLKREMSHTHNDEVFWEMSLLRRIIAKEKDEERVQKKLTSYFKCVEI